jgi:hypothetical protein
MLRALWKSFFDGPPRPAPQRNRAVLWVESLEDRTVPSAASVKPSGEGPVEAKVCQRPLESCVRVDHATSAGCQSEGKSGATKHGAVKRHQHKGHNKRHHQQGKDQNKRLRDNNTSEKSALAKDELSKKDVKTAIGRDKDNKKTDGVKTYNRPIPIKKTVERKADATYVTKLEERRPAEDPAPDEESKPEFKKPEFKKLEFPTADCAKADLARRDSSEPDNAESNWSPADCSPRERETWQAEDWAG